MTPTIPNTRAAGMERFMINPTRALIGLPHPGRSMILALAVRAAATSNVIAIFPKRISSLSKKRQIRLFRF